MTAPVRVAFHAGQLLQPVPGGIGRYETALLRRLGEHGVEPIAFAAGPRPADVAPFVPWLDLGAPRGSVRYEMWHRLRRPVVRIDADVVHAPSLVIPPTGRTPLVVTVHDVAFLRLPDVTTRRGVSFHTHALALARRHADTVIVPSAFTRDELEREGFDRDRVRVVPFGVNDPYPREDADLDATISALGVTSPYVLTVGTVEPRKDIPTVVRAIETLRRTHPDVTLVVAGPRGWGEVTGIERSFVRVVGAQPWPVLDALFRRAAVFCSASLYEGFGLPAVEAMARGTPTVVTTGSSLEEVVADAGATFAPGDTDACARLLAETLDDTARHNSMRRAGRARARALNWDTCAEGHVRAYEAAVARAGP